jgi:hypothetical protein
VNGAVGATLVVAPLSDPDGATTGYRAKPDFAHVPVAVSTLSQLGALHDTETAAVNQTFATDQASGSFSQSGRRTGVILHHASRDIRRTLPRPELILVRLETCSVQSSPRGKR